MRKRLETQVDKSERVNEVVTNDNLTLTTGTIDNFAGVFNGVTFLDQMVVTRDGDADVVRLQVETHAANARVVESSTTLQVRMLVSCIDVGDVDQDLDKFRSVVNHNTSKFVQVHTITSIQSHRPSQLTLLPFASSTFRSPVLPPAISSSTLAATPSPLPNASRTRPKAIFGICVSRASIGMFCGAYASFPSMLTWFYCPGSLVILVSNLRGEFRILDLN